MSTRLRIALAWVLLAGSLIGWPLSLLFAKDEPPLVMSLSWLALTLTALDILSTQDVRHKQEGGEDG